MRSVRFVVLVSVLALLIACPPGRPTSPRGMVGDVPGDIFGNLPPPAEEPVPESPLRPGPTPPPRAGERESLAFPPEAPTPGAPPSVPVGPLRVLRTQPDGLDAVGGGVVVTFSQPMVPLGTVGNVANAAAAPAPLEISPRPEGRFRWLGSSTLAFEPVGRLPFATAFVARVPAGTRSAVGGVLAAESTFRFETPALEVVERIPEGDHVGLDAPIALLFNQRIDAVALARAVQVRAGAAAVAVRAIPFDEARGLGETGLRIQSWTPDRTLVLVPERPFARSTRVALSIPAGTRGAEGPKGLARAYGGTFTTHGPLSLGALKCEEPRCRPGTGIWVSATNPIEDRELARLVRVEPAVDDLTVAAYGDGIHIGGALLAQTRYRVTVDAALKDVFGQTLGAAWTGEIAMGDAVPDFSFPLAGSTILEATGPRQIPLNLTNLRDVRLRMWRFEPDALPALHASSFLDGDERAAVPAVLRAAGDRRVPTGMTKNRPMILGLPVDDALGGARTGLLVVEVQAPEVRAADRWAQTVQRLVVQVTGLGLTVRTDADHAYVVVTELATARPVAGANVALKDVQGRQLAAVRSGADGKAVLTVGQVPSGWIVAEREGDVVTASVNEQYARRRWVVAALHSERGVYRPGEHVHVHGTVRIASRDRPGELAAAPDGSSIRYTVTSPEGREVGSGDARLTAHGTMHVEIPIPVGADLGVYSLQGTLTPGVRNGANGEGQVSTTFQVQEYRAPEFEVDVSVEGGDVVLQGSEVRATIEGRYLFGAAMAGASVRYTVVRRPSGFRPPRHDSFVFAERWVPIWQIRARNQGIGGRRIRIDDSFFPAAGDTVLSGEGRLDAQGRLQLRVPVSPDDEEPGPCDYTVEAQVTDENRQAVAGRTSFVGHPSPFYLGLRTAKRLVTAGERASAELVAVEPGGARRQGVAARVEVVRRRVEGRFERGPGGLWTWRQTVTDEPLSECAVTSAADPVSCAFRPPRAGMYVVRATSDAGGGRRARTELAVFVTGPGQTAWEQSDPGVVDLVADRTEYSVGDTAHILVQSPFPRSLAVISLESGGVRDLRVQELQAASTIDVPITRASLPNVTVRVVLLRGRVAPAELGVPEADAIAQDLGRPAVVEGELALEVRRGSRAVGVSVTTGARTARPGTSVPIEVRAVVEDQPAQDVAVAVWAVDDAVLALLGTETPDLLAEMYPDTSPDTDGSDARRMLLKREAMSGIVRNLRGGGMMGAPGGAGGAAPQPAAQSRVFRLESMNIEGREADVAPAFALRSRFATTPLFAGYLTTGADGVARTTLELPDNLTTYRIIALAARGTDRFGSADARVTVNKPLLLRPALPRFVYPGDRFQASVTVHNETGADADLIVMARAAGARIVGSNRREISLGAGEKRELLFPAEPVRPGAARVQFGAVATKRGRPGGRETDAVELSVPILVPASTEAFATYGSTEESTAQPIAPPEGVLDWGGLDVELSSTALVGLQDAAESVLEYPWECAEQVASRLRVLSALRDIGPDFAIDGLESRPVIDARAGEAVRKLAALQHWDGGFRLWTSSPGATLHVSAYAMLALEEARRAGFAVPDPVFERGRNFVRSRLTRPERDFGEDVDLVSQALAVLVLSDAGGPAGEVEPHLRRLYEKRAQLPLFAQAWLLTAAFRISPTDPRAVELRRLLENAAVETPAGAHFAEDHAEAFRMIFHSARETDAVALDALVRIDRAHPLLAKLTRGLMQARVRGHWGSTYTDAAVLSALRRYYDATEAAPPNFRAAIWLGAQTTGETAFVGRTLRVAEQHIPMAAVLDGGARDVILSVQGRGRLYYRMGLRYIPERGELPPEEQGFAVARTYEAVEDPGDVRTSPDGATTLRAGAVIRVRLTLVVPDDRHHVVLDDPLPAGLEAVNLGFATTAQEMLQRHVERRVTDTGYWNRWYALFAFDHTEMRDERVAAFATRLPAGVYEYTYLARATTPGRYLAPPTRVEEMYAPELFGRTASTHVIVE